MENIIKNITDNKKNKKISECFIKCLKKCDDNNKTIHNFYAVSYSREYYQCSLKCYELKDKSEKQNINNDILNWILYNESIVNNNI